MPLSFKEKYFTSNGNSLFQYGQAIKYSKGKSNFGFMASKLMDYITTNPINEGFDIQRFAKSLNLSGEMPLRLAKIFTKASGESANGSNVGKKVAEYYAELIKNECAEYNAKKSKPRLEKTLSKSCRELLKAQIHRLDLELDNVTKTIKGMDSSLFCDIVDDETQENVEFENIISEESGKNIYICADGGFGKTSRMIFEANQLLNNGRYCLYVPCYSYGDANTSNLIEKKLKEVFNDISSDELKKTLKSSFAQTQFVLFLDGFNEAVNRSHLSCEIRNLSDLTGLKIIVSSRYDDPSFQNFRRLSMRNLQISTVKAALKSIEDETVCYSGLSADVQSLLTVPMFLKLFVSSPNVNVASSAALLLDSDRARIVSKIQLDIGGLGSEEGRLATISLEQAFPSFVFNEYNYNRSLLFTKKSLTSFINETQGVDADGALRVVDFLNKNHVIVDNGNDSFTYRHEHFRDYWVSYYIRAALSNCKTIEELYNKILDIFCHPFSDSVLHFFGDLAHISVEKDGLINHCLDALRINSHNVNCWKDDKSAIATANVLRVLSVALNGNISGVNLSRLNLSRTELNGVITSELVGGKLRCCNYGDAMISESTFVKIAHSSALRRIEVVSAGGNDYLVSFGTLEMLISRMPDISPIKKYKYAYPTDASSKFVGVLVSTATIENTIIGVCGDGSVHRWFFYEDEHSQLCCKMYSLGNTDGSMQFKQKAKKVCRYVANGIAYFCVLFDNGSIGLFNAITAERIDKVAGIHINCKSQAFAADGEESRLFWLDKCENDISVFCYQNGAIAELCSFSAVKMTPGIMEYCAEKALLVFSVVSEESTDIYQFCVDEPNACIQHIATLDNDIAITKMKYNKVNSFDFFKEKLLLACDDGKVYLYVYHDGNYKFNSSASISNGEGFPNERAVFVENGRYVVAASIDRSISLWSVEPFFEKRRLSGNNDGLRRLVKLEGNRMLATTYDGALIDVVQDASGNYVCQNKAMIDKSSWCWSIAQIDNETYAVGCTGIIKIVNITTGNVLLTINDCVGRVEYLYYDKTESLLLSAERMQTVARKIAKNDAGTFSYREKRTIESLNNKFVYCICGCDDSLLVGVSTAADDCTNLYAFNHPGESPEKLVPLKQSIVNAEFLGRFRDIHRFGDYVLAVGLCNKESFFSIIYEYSDKNGFCEICRLEGHSQYVVRGAVTKDGHGGWRIATVGNDGAINMYSFTADKELKIIKAASIKQKLFDIVFESDSTMLVTCLDGGLYRLNWGEARMECVFRNKCGFFTFGSRFAGVAVDKNSEFARLLDYFGDLYGKDMKLI